eukprot:15159992-Alexandrium_andersonii.AAC.1
MPQVAKVRVCPACRGRFRPSGALCSMCDRHARRCVCDAGEQISTLAFQPDASSCPASCPSPSTAP